MIFDSSSKKLLLIAGPCSLESRELSLEVASEVARLSKKFSEEIIVVFKGSFDKPTAQALKARAELE